MMGGRAQETDESGGDGKIHEEAEREASADSHMDRKGGIMIR